MNNLPSEMRIVLAAIALAMASQASAIDPTGKISPELQAQLAAKETAPVRVLITPRVDAATRVDIAELSARTAPKYRPQVVHRALRAQAESAQADLVKWLRREGFSYRAFTVVNAVAAELPADRVPALAKRADVLRIEADPVIRQQLPRPEPFLFGKSVLAVEPGVAYINANDVWALPGNPRGGGVVIAGQDTGYRWTHAALQGKYRGWNGGSADHNYNWHDAIHSGGGVCGADAVAPCDDNGHGTHTMGTMVGDDGGTNQVGVAPDAKWIACRNMDQGNGTPTTYLECFNFFLAPYPVGGTPAQGNPNLAPHVINNSWGCPTSEGCNSGNWATMQTAVENLTAAGILVVVSAGNSGSSCSTVVDPPAFFDASFSVGAFSSGTGTIASFSSRGPVTVDGSNRMKPDIAAPGVSVRSSTSGGDTSYGLSSGTSMAGPHVAGAAALLMSAVPSLQRQPALVRQYLSQSATPVSVTNTCSSNGVPNNVYGNGRLDVLAAVQAALAATPEIFLDGFE